MTALGRVDRTTRKLDTSSSDGKRPSGETVDRRAVWHFFGRIEESTLIWVRFQAPNVTQMNDWIAIGALGVIAVAIPLGMMAVSYLLRPSVPETSKRATYESGEVPTGDTRIRFNIQYYMVALLFVVFDIETVLLFPWAVVYTDALAEYGMVHALAPMLAFVFILLVGLAWAWRNGAVQWTRSPRVEPEADRP